MGGLSITHLLVVLIVALLLFGAGRVADVGKGLGEGIRNFKKGLKDDEADPPPVKRKVVIADEDDVVEVVKAPKQLAVASPVTAGKKKKVIQIEVDEDEDEEEIARRIVAKPKAKAVQSEDEKAT